MVHYWVPIAAVVRNVSPYSSMLTRTFARIWELYKQRFPWPEHATDNRDTSHPSWFSFWMAAISIYKRRGKYYKQNKFIHSAWTVHINNNLHAFKSNFVINTLYKNKQIIWFWSGESTPGFSSHLSSENAVVISFITYSVILIYFVRCNAILSHALQPSGYLQMRNPVNDQLAQTLISIMTAGR